MPLTSSGSNTLRPLSPDCDRDLESPLRSGDIFEVYESFRVVPDRYLDNGGKVVVPAHNRGTARGSGIELDQAFAYVWTVRVGELARLEVYGDERAALQAAGLRE